MRSGREVSQRPQCPRLQTSTGRSPSSACPRSGPRRAEAGPLSELLAGLQDPRLGAGHGGHQGWEPGQHYLHMSPWGPSSLNKETDHVAWAPSRIYPCAPGRFGPRARSAAAWTCLWPWAGAGLFWAWPGPCDIGILAASWPGHRDRLDVSLTGAKGGWGLCKLHSGASPTWACP